MAHKVDELLEAELNDAKSQLKVGGIYCHYKNPERYYKIIGFAVQEATEKICVIYQAQYSKKFTFVRDLDSWLENPVISGKKVARFTLIQ